MSTVTTKDGTQIYDKDWGSGPPVMFSHGWPLSAGAWDDQMLFLAARGFRCIAHDRRGHGRSSQPWSGNEMDTYADDLAALAGALDLKGAVHVGHSTGGGEVARYLGRHGTKRAAKAVLIGAVTEDLAKIDVPTLILHGDDDQIVPIGASAMRSAKLVKGATLKVYPGLPHGMCSTAKDQINANRLAFLK
jgi:pimeloyl-ACP methyl ester carboxylesterase